MRYALGQFISDAFCKIHPRLAQKFVTRSAHAAVSKISADALLAKALSAQTGSLPKAIREVNAIKLEGTDTLVGHIGIILLALNLTFLIIHTLTQNHLGPFQ